MKGFKAHCVVFLALLLLPIAAHAVVMDNSPPVADAGPDQTLKVGEIATLDGGASYDPDLDVIIVSYSWMFISIPPGSNAEITPSADSPAAATFTPDVPGAYVAQLTVNDGFADSSPDTTTIQAQSGGTPLETVIEAIEQLKTEIGSLPRSAFRYVLSKRLLTVELNLVIASLEMERYRIALLLLRNNILPVTDGCFKNGFPDRNDWIVDCRVQTTVYSELQEIIDLVKQML